MRTFLLCIAIAAGLCGQIRTGPAIGSAIPKFEAPDQNGRVRTFDSIAGPKGALLVFYRSADW